MRARGKEFHPNTRAFFRRVAQVDDTAFLFFFGDGIDEHDFGAERERFLQIKQAAMLCGGGGCLFSRNFWPSLFWAIARTGMRVKTRELRRAVLFCGSLMVICYAASGPTLSQP